MLGNKDNPPLPIKIIFISILFIFFFIPISNSLDVYQSFYDKGYFRINNSKCDKQDFFSGNYELCEYVDFENRFYGMLNSSDQAKKISSFSNLSSVMALAGGDTSAYALGLISFDNPINVINSYSRFSWTYNGNNVLTFVMLDENGDCIVGQSSRGGLSTLTEDCIYRLPGNTNDSINLGHIYSTEINNDFFRYNMTDEYKRSIKAIGFYGYDIDANVLINNLLLSNITIYHNNTLPQGEFIYDTTLCIDREIETGVSTFINNTFIDEEGDNILVVLEDYTDINSILDETFQDVDNIDLRELYQDENKTIKGKTLDYPNFDILDNSTFYSSCVYELPFFNNLQGEYSSWFEDYYLKSDESCEYPFYISLDRIPSGNYKIFSDYILENNYNETNYFSFGYVFEGVTYYETLIERNNATSQTTISFFGESSINFSLVDRNYYRIVSEITEDNNIILTRVYYYNDSNKFNTQDYIEDGFILLAESSEYPANFKVNTLKFTPETIHTYAIDNIFILEQYKILSSEAIEDFGLFEFNKTGSYTYTIKVTDNIHYGINYTSYDISINVMDCSNIFIQNLDDDTLNFVNTLHDLTYTVCGLGNDIYGMFGGDQKADIDFCVIGMWVSFIGCMILAIGTGSLFMFISSDFVFPVSMITQLVYMFLTSLIIDYSIQIKLFSGFMFAIGIAILIRSIIFNQHSAGGVL